MICRYCHNVSNSGGTVCNTCRVARNDVESYWLCALCGVPGEVVWTVNIDVHPTERQFAICRDCEREEYLYVKDFRRWCAARYVEHREFHAASSPWPWTSTFEGDYWRERGFDPYPEFERRLTAGTRRVRETAGRIRG